MLSSTAVLLDYKSFIYMKVYYKYLKSLNLMISMPAEICQLLKYVNKKCLWKKNEFDIFFFK